jgi:serine/threonine-protein kinase
MGTGHPVESESQPEGSVPLGAGSRLAEFRPQPSTKAGLRLGDRYVIAGQLATGATSDVFLAHDEQSGSPVMVKWLKPHAARSPQLRARFVMSARVTMAVNHPAVVRVHGVEEPADEPPYLVMEALSGEPLSEYLAREGSMLEPLVLALARDVAAGLAAAHRVGIIHRDIKPGNLFLVGPVGAPVAAKIIDFGLAKDTQERETGPSSKNLVLGTAQYIAPEQVLADPIDGRADIYALGAVLFRALTGQLPFDVGAGVDLFGHQVFSPMPPPSWLLEDVDPRLEQLVLRSTRKDPDNRYPSMDAVLADLETICGQRHQSAGRISELPLVRDPDVYMPRNPKGRDTAEALASYFGTAPPPPPASGLGSPPVAAADDGGEPVAEG